METKTYSKELKEYQLEEENKQKEEIDGLLDRL